ncbi:hypothetical protein AK812_SmicGene21167 [Symbiodinium microadriaticum]|uniref:CHASE domain-containing protein n=1 Tax=Symbiodinium microadriaticum TaxID=2951 RepID=A0A1Q9DN25_SYMMI|nr:hypothetical protein AK812_SmicGene21167 [Symbiodinium microadriaticum]
MLLAKVTMTSCGIPVEGELGYVPDDEDAEHAGSAAVNDESQTWKVIDPLGSKRIPLRSEDGLVIFDATAMAPNAIVSDSIRRSEQSAKYSVVLYGRDNAPASVDRTSLRGRSGRARTSGLACGATASLFATPALLARRSRAQCARPAAGEVSLEDLDRSDPGRSALRSEWAVAGEVLFEEVTEASGLVRVTGSGASNGGSWRRLRFNGNTEQSVLLLDASKTPEFGALAFGYLKSLAAVGTSTARALGRPETLRVLVVGVGLGALPGWFCKKMKATVDAVELDPAVLRAAAAIGGIPAGSVCDAGNARECAKDAAERAPEPATIFVQHTADVLPSILLALGCYDVVIVDVFDGQGETPQAFLEDRFGAALGGIAECAAANLTCPGYHRGMPHSPGDIPAEGLDDFDIIRDYVPHTIESASLGVQYRNPGPGSPISYRSDDNLPVTKMVQSPSQGGSFRQETAPMEGNPRKELLRYGNSGAKVKVHTRESLLDLTKTYAGEMTRQVRTSASSVQALEAIIRIDEMGNSAQNFDNLADTFIKTYQGISNLQLAPAGQIERIYPLQDEKQDNTPALGLNLLLHPDHEVEALASVLERRTTVIGPLRLLQGGVALIVRHPIFSPYAPQYLPDAWAVADGINYTRVCSIPDLRSESCSYAGPHDEAGRQTYFWGFATMLAKVEDLTAPVQLERLQLGKHRVAGMEDFSFAYRIFDNDPHPSLDRPIYAESSEKQSWMDYVQVQILAEELRVDWTLQVMPQNGWPLVSADFWRQLLVVLPMTGLLGVGLGISILITMRKRAQQLLRLEEYRREVISRTILASISNLDLLQFPMCVLKVDDFLRLGELICHEDAREARRLRCIDIAEEAARLCQEEGVAFLSHQWASFEHPDPDGVQYRAMVKAVEEVLTRGIKCSWVWVDYCSIPQRNTFQQQTAINSLSVYASYCSVFLSVVPPCIHADTGHNIDINSYASRAWCRLEKLSFGTAGWNSDGRLAFMCTQDGISNDWAAIFDDDAVLDVAGGAFSCCTRNHPDGKPCDKQKIVGILAAHCGYSDALTM